MQVSLKWLRDYVAIDMEPEALAEKLTMAGLEVESLERKAPSFNGVVVARIVAIKPHPQADKLSLCDVTDGEKTYKVVCGAPNITIDDVVPLAKAGAVLRSGATIKETTIRGERSCGMLCSEEELGIGSDASGVMILTRFGGDRSIPLAPGYDKPVTMGEDLGDALGLADVIFTISITPNRADCLSVIGLAREIAVLTGKRLHIPAIRLRESEEDIHGLTSVIIEAPDLCPRYSARILKHVLVKPSPLWMRQRLEGAGLRAINNVVDVTNFVMLEMGQPLHAFDYRYLEEGRIVVRRAREGEIFATLDEKERVLRAGTLLICDGVKPVAIGGIMGGVNSEVKEDTETVLLESAYFNPTSIRVSAKTLGMGTDASFRFERGIDPEGVIHAQNRAAQLITELTGGISCRGVIDQYPVKVKTARNIPLRTKRVESIIGANIKASEFLPILEGLEMDIQDTGAGDFLVTPPTFRVDIEREIDLIEEIVRIHGYDSLPVTLPVVSLKSVNRETRMTLEGRIKEMLRGNGYSEIISYSFVSPKWIDHLGFPEDDERRNVVRIKNPLTEEQSVMRTTLLYGLLETMKRNAHTGTLDLKIFEVGRVFIDRAASELPKEKNHLACLLTGMQDEEKWYAKRMADFYDLKGCTENLFADLRLPIAFRADLLHEPFLHPGKSSGILIGERLAGYIGEVHHNVIDSLDLKTQAFVMELDLDALAEAYSNRIAYREVSQYPSITRDVALLIDKHIEIDKVFNVIHEIDEELLEKVRVFDVYEGKGIPDGQQSLGLRFTYRSSEKTLTDEHITKVHSGLVEKIISVTGSRIRG